METIILCAWLFAAAAFANPGPVLANNVPLFKKFSTPLDLGKTFRGKRIFGENKTIRGLVSGVVMGMACGLIQFILASQFDAFADITTLVDYTSPLVIFYTGVIGAGAIAGDAIESFFKRQLDIHPGENWIPFDQTDFILGSILVSFFFFVLSPAQYLIIVAVALFLHPIYNVISWLLGLQEKPF